MAGSAADAAADAAAEAADPSGMAWAKHLLELEQEQLQEALADIAGTKPGQVQLDELGGTEGDWTLLLEYSKLQLQPVQLVAWFDALKQQRDVLLEALHELPKGHLQAGECCGEMACSCSRHVAWLLSV
jgi:hypothetical protein